ncbi:MAG: hypothetical protein ACYS9X_21635 [Planctomycetota bacterium]
MAEHPSSSPTLAGSVERRYAEGSLPEAYERAEKLRVELAREIIRQGIEDLTRYMSTGPTESFLKQEAYERIKAVDRDLAIEVLCDYARSLGPETDLPMASRKGVAIGAVMQSFWDRRTTSYFNSLLDDREVWYWAVYTLQFLADEHFGLNSAPPPWEESKEIRRKAREWALRYLEREKLMHRPAAMGGTALPLPRERLKKTRHGTGAPAGNPKVDSARPHR